MQTEPHHPAPWTSSHWFGRLAIDVEQVDKRSVLRKVSHTGPLRVQRAFYPEANGTCHVYILHPPGGVVGGDELELRVHVGTNARCLVTTPGAAKLYRCDTIGSRIQNHILVEDGARLDFLPQETIAFNGTTSHLKTVIELHGRAEYLGWDVICFGRPAAGEVFSRGSLSFEQRVTRDGLPLLAERLLVNGSSDIFRQPWGLGGFTVVGTLLVTTPDLRWIDWIRQELPQLTGSDVVWSGSELDGISVFRALGHTAEAVRSVLHALWDACRKRLGSDGHHTPRIWKL